MGWLTHMQINGIQKRLRTSSESNLQSRRQNLRQAIEAKYDASLTTILSFKCEIGWRFWFVTEAQEIIGVVCLHFSGTPAGGPNYIPSNIVILNSLARARTSLRRSRVALMPVGLHPNCSERGHTLSYSHSGFGSLEPCRGPSADVCWSAS